MKYKLCPNSTELLLSTLFTNHVLNKLYLKQAAFSLGIDLMMADTLCPSVTSRAEIKQTNPVVIAATWKRHYGQWKETLDFLTLVSRYSYFTFFGCEESPRSLFGTLHKQLLHINESIINFVNWREESWTGKAAGGGNKRVGSNLNLIFSVSKYKYQHLNHLCYGISMVWLDSSKSR